MKNTSMSLICFIFSDHKEWGSVSPKEIIVDVILTPIPKTNSTTEEVFQLYVVGLYVVA